MQLDVEVSPPAFVGAQLELKCTCSVPGVYMRCRLHCLCSTYDHRSSPILVSNLVQSQTYSLYDFLSSDFLSSLNFGPVTDV